MPTGSILTLPVPADFDLDRAVCSYGYFMLAPNQWLPGRRTFTRVLRDTADRPVSVHVTQPRGPGHRLRMRCARKLTPPDQKRIKTGLRRMLRVDEDFTDWFAKNPQAARERFGRLLRSPTLFEDIVKTITGCNVAWPSTMRMNRLLCEQIGGGAFPTPRELAAITPAKLKTTTKVGYRAERIVNLAKSVESGDLDLAWFEAPERESDEVYTALRQIHGLGPYAAANVCHHLGFYDQLAIDSETYRHFTAHFRVKNPKRDNALHQRIVKHYRRYAPYQFLAYWHELWRDYEQKLGDARTWDAQRGARVTRQS
jgi:3-methyladenine DNA glycosylase/8-oxoguanine DNA glycosylase